MKSKRILNKISEILFEIQKILPTLKVYISPVNLSGVNRFAWRCDKQLTADLTALLASVFTKLWVLFSYSKKWLLHFLYLSKVRWLTKASLIRLIKNFLAKNKKVSLVIIEARYLFDNRYKFYLQYRLEIVLKTHQHVVMIMMIY